LRQQAGELKETTRSLARPVLYRVCLVDFLGKALFRSLLTMSRFESALCLCVLLGITVANSGNPLNDPGASTMPLSHRQIGLQSRSAAATWKFDFGPGPLASGYQRVMPQNLYSREAGFGFEPGPPVTCLERASKDPLRGDFCTSEKPFYFSVALPEGDYNVTVTVGDATASSVTTVKAELRRLMIERSRDEGRQIRTPHIHRERAHAANR
jgi:hypothetical protein